MLTVGSIPQITESLIESAPGMVAQAPQVCINVVIPIVGQLSGLLPTVTTEMLAGLIPDSIRIVLGTLPMWPDLAPFHAAWLAELPSIVLAFIDALPGIYATFSLTSTLSSLLKLLTMLIRLNFPPYCVPYYSSIFSALVQEVPPLLANPVLLPKIIWAYGGCFSLPVLEDAFLPQYILAIISCTTGLITSLTEILSALISTMPSLGRMRMDR